MSFDKQLRPMDSDSFRSFQTPPSQKRSNSISIIYVSPECAEVLSKKQQAGSRRRKMPNLTSFGGVCDTPISVYKSGKTRVFEKKLHSILNSVSNCLRFVFLDYCYAFERKAFCKTLSNLTSGLAF